MNELTEKELSVLIFHHADMVAYYTKDQSLRNIHTVRIAKLKKQRTEVRVANGIDKELQDD